jgi:hypothetical protein
MVAAGILPVNASDLGKLLKAELETPVEKLDTMRRGPRAAPQSYYKGLA